MSPLEFIFIIALLQIILSATLLIYKLRFAGLALLLLLLIGDFFIFPPYFFPPVKNPDEGNCGLPLLSIQLAFIFIGGLASVLIYAVFFFIKRHQIQKG